MSLSDPLPAASFADLLKTADVKLTLAATQKRSLSGGGETLYADRAPMLWHADITTAPMPNADAEALMALVNSRGGGLRTVLLYNPRLQYPASDPDGAIFDTFTPTVNVVTDARHVSFSAFPAGYVIPLGTYFGILFDTSRYYLGQFAEARTANPITGAVASVEVTPPLPDAVASGAAVTVARPPFRATIVPGSAYLSSIDTINARLAVSAEQTYRA